MTIFKEKDLNQVSDDYYNAYKAELEQSEKKGVMLSLNNIIKFEFFTLIAGFIFLSYNNFFNQFSIEFQENFFTSNVMFSQKSSLAHTDSLLLEQLKLAEVDRIIPVKIKEEKPIKKEVAMIPNKLNINSTDMTLLVEIIKSQLAEPATSIEEDSIIISQI